VPTQFVPREPPEHLPEDAQAVWREVFRACRADQFAGCLFLVESYARTDAARACINRT
jgi:hypothetical protein